jgi:hypothetical protein
LAKRLNITRKLTKVQLRQLSEDRILGAECLLAAGRWSGAYYLSGYAVECGLKACIMAYNQATGAIFQDLAATLTHGTIPMARCGIASTRRMG